MFMNPLYLLLLIPAVLGWYAQVRVQAAYARHARELNRHGLMGAEIAEQLIAHLGLKDVSIELMYGQFGDHYDMRDRTLVLTEGVAASRSVTAMGIVAHEVLHAVQDREGYALLRLRGWLGERLARVPGIAFWGAALGLLFRSTPLVLIGGAVMVLSVLLGLTALPVERNASRRALEALRESGLADADDLAGAEAVLRSAALTYVAGLCQQIGRLAFAGLVISAAYGFWQR